MGIFDFLGDASNLETFLNGGLIGVALKSSTQKSGGGTTSPKLGKYCSTQCTEGRECCEACAELQKKLEQELLELEKLEDSENLSMDQVQQLSSRPKITNCSLCGALVEKGNAECPYCGTPYPSGGIDCEIPLSKIERKQKTDEKAQEAWNTLVEIMGLQGKNSRESLGDNLLGKFAKMIEGYAASFQSMLMQNADEIRQGAAHYGVALAIYIDGVAKGKMMSPKSLVMAEQNRIMEEQRASQEQQRAAASAAAAATAAAQPQRKSYTMLDYMQQRAQTSSPGYVGGPSQLGSCCGNCRYYLAHDKKCLYYQGTSGQYRSGPNDYCNRHYSV